MNQHDATHRLTVYRPFRGSGNLSFGITQPRHRVEKSVEGLK